MQTILKQKTGQILPMGHHLPTLILEDDEATKRRKWPLELWSRDPPPTHTHIHSLASTGSREKLLCSVRNCILESKLEIPNTPPRLGMVVHARQDT